MTRIDWALIGIIVVALVATVAVYTTRANAPPLDADVRGKVIPDDLVPPETEIIAVIHPECPYCVSSVPAWNAVLGRGIRLVGVSRGTPEQAAEFIEVSRAEFPVVVTPDSEWEQGLALKGVPYTLGISPGREVEFAYMGWLQSEEPIFALLVTRR